MGSFTTSGGGGVTESTSLTDTADLTYNADTDASEKGWTIDEDNMASDSATKVPTQQSVKAYVDTQVAGAGGGAWEYINTYSSTGSTKIDIATISTTYKHLMIVAPIIASYTDGAYVRLQVQDGNVNGTNYDWSLQEITCESTPTVTYEGATADSYVHLTRAMGLDGAEGFGFTLFMRNLHDTSDGTTDMYVTMDWQGMYKDTGGISRTVTGSARFDSQDNIDGCELSLSSGSNNLVGELHVYGLKES